MEGRDGRSEGDRQAMGIRWPVRLHSTPRWYLLVQNNVHVLNNAVLRGRANAEGKTCFTFISFHTSVFSQDQVALYTLFKDLSVNAIGIPLLKMPRNVRICGQTYGHLICHVILRALSSMSVTREFH